jgi:6-phosphogluconate dehydrogenase
MELCMVGLGRMGANMTERLIRAGHQVVAYDRDAQAVERVVAKGSAKGASLREAVTSLRSPRVVWLMIPSGNPLDKAIDELLGFLQAGDIIIDGGNSNYKDSIRRAALVKEKGIHFVDVGTSGGIWGLQEGYALMVGGGAEAVQRLTPIFESLAPAPDKGWGHVGPSGAGHFVKMIHNGIEYGLMQAYAEGFAIMERKKEFALDLERISEIWRHGSVVRSWLLDLIANALTENPTLSGIKPYVEDSGEGRWTVVEAVDLAVSAPVITSSLMERFRSRDQNSYMDRLLAMMRYQFGGHAMEKEK